GGDHGNTMFQPVETPGETIFQPGKKSFDGVHYRGTTEEADAAGLRFYAFTDRAGGGLELFDSGHGVVQVRDTEFSLEPQVHPGVFFVQFVESDGTREAAFRIEGDFA